MRNPKTIETQLEFDALLTSAEAANSRRLKESACIHLPETMDEAVPFLRGLIVRHHEAMLAGDGEAVRTLRDEARRLAFKLNRFEPGILADDDAAGCVLDRATAAPSGTVPLWGQSGSFEIACGGMRIRIEMQGLFGLALYAAWPGFAAHAIEWGKLFLSETGYRSFLGVGGALRPGFTPDAFAAAIIEAHVRGELKGRLVTINAASLKCANRMRP